MVSIRRFLRKARRLSIKRWFWVALSALVMVVVWISIRLFHFFPVYTTLKKMSPRRDQKLRPAAVDAICWAIPRTGKLLFGKNDGCLYQALAGEYLLSWFGKKAVLRIGVRKVSDQMVLAHAWVEGDGTILIGGDKNIIYNSFQPLPDLSVAFKVT